MFKDREEAGRLLAEALDFLRDRKDVIVLAIPRGGLVVAKEVADHLNSPLDLIVTRKLGAPGNPELAVGAVTQDGASILEPELIRRLGIPDSYLARESAEQSAEIERRMRIYRGDRSYPVLDGRIVVIVDDGVATGSTARAAILSAQARNAARVILALPVGPKETISRLAETANRVVCLSTPEPFHAIGRFYDDFGQVEEETVIRILVGRQASR
ncbi:MAG: phosphoribosyltransferase family protein [Thaumarchaeota archaeon]|nr:phosphoribosyltransferase family protein [Nitrososphaerota archaeon]